MSNSRLKIESIRPVGERALLIELPDLDAALAVRATLDRRPAPGQIDLVAGARTVLVVLAAPADLAPARSYLGTLEVESVAASGISAAGLMEIPVVYDGPDLAAVGALTGLTEEQISDAHSGTEWTVAFGGFAPGFFYLAGGDPRLVVQRRETSRTAVAPGSVGLAGEFSGVYPRASPGGWQLIGRTDAVMWDINRDPPTLLRPGMRVRFRQIDKLGGSSQQSGQQSGRQTGRQSSQQSSQQYSEQSGQQSGWQTGRQSSQQYSEQSGQQLGRRTGQEYSQHGARTTAKAHGTTGDIVEGAGSLEIESPGILCTIEDLGRPSFADLGVSPSGAADVGAALQANVLVGNEASAAVLEVTLGRLRMLAQGDQILAVAGAPVPITVLPPVGVPIEYPAQTAFAVPDGARIRLGKPVAGLRSYVAVRGGITVPTVLGSRSTDLLSGIGPPVVRAGDVLPVGSARAFDTTAPPEPANDPDFANRPGTAGTPFITSNSETAGLQLLPGPRDDWFTPESLRHLVDQEYIVTPQSNRVGLRLNGAVPIERRIPDELPSEGVVAGAVQIPPSGQPVIFLADHPVTGGYPVVGVLTRKSIDQAAQLPPGARLRFAWAGADTEPADTEPADTEPADAEPTDTALRTAQSRAKAPRLSAG